MVDLVTLGGLQRMQYPQFSTSMPLTAASAGTQAGGTLCNSSVSYFGTVGGAGYSATLPKAVLGRELSVVNAGANALALFPASGDAIDSLAANASYSVLPGQIITLTCGVSGKWFTDMPASQTGASFAGIASGSFSASSNTTLANVTGLSVNVVSGATYSIWGYLLTSANSAAGIKIGIAGGTATATSVGIDTWGYATTTLSAENQITSLTTMLGVTAAINAVEFTGFIKVNAGGTLQMQAAQNVSNAAATTIANGSFIQLCRIA